MNKEYLKKITELKRVKPTYLSSFKEAISLSEKAKGELDVARDSVDTIIDALSYLQMSYENAYVSLSKAHKILADIQSTLDEMGLEYHPELTEAFDKFNEAIDLEYDLVTDSEVQEAIPSGVLQGGFPDNISY